MNKVLKDIQGSQEANMIETLSIRTMAKAVYTTENIGHYGLDLITTPILPHLYDVILMLWYIDFYSII